MDRIEELSARLAEVEAHNVTLMEHVKGQDVLEQQYKSALASKDKRIEELREKVKELDGTIDHMVAVGEPERNRIKGVEKEKAVLEKALSQTIIERDYACAERATLKDAMEKIVNLLILSMALEDKDKMETIKVLGKINAIATTALATMKDKPKCGTCGKAGKNNMVFNEKEKREHPCPTCLDVELLPKLCLKCLGTKVDKSRVLRDDINKHPPCPECDPGKEK